MNTSNVKCINPKCEQLNPPTEPFCVFCSTPIEGNAHGRRLQSMVDTQIEKKMDELKVDLKRYATIVGATATIATSVIGFLGYTKWEELKSIPETTIKSQVEAAIANVKVKDQLDRLVKETQTSADQIRSGNTETFKELGRIEERLKQANENLTERRKEADRAGAQIQEVEATTNTLRGKFAKTDEAYAQFFQRESKLKEMMSLLAGEDAAAVFAKIQNDFAAIKTLQVRIQYFFGKGEMTFFPFRHISLAPADRHHVAEMYPVERSLTSIQLEDGEQTYVHKFQLFEMFAMQLEGQPVSTLDKLQRATLAYTTKPGELDEDYRKERAELLAAFNRLRKIEMTILVNGYPVSRADGERNTLEIQPEDKIATEGDFIAVDFDVSKCFADTKSTLTAAVFKAQQTIAPPGNVETPRSQ